MLLCFYYLLCWLVWLIGAPFALLLSFIKPKFKQSFKARFFLWRNLRQSMADVHFHACSLGEVRSIEELARAYDSRVSVITQTGFEAARSFCARSNYLAFENFIPFWLAPCKVLVVFEAEFWLMLFFMAKRKGAKIMLINARMSEKSFAKYLKFKFFYRHIFALIDEIFAQSEQDKARLEALGAKNIQICGNLKAAMSPKITRLYTKPHARVILFASTHEGEEELLLKHFKSTPNELLVFAVRHPERFLKMSKMLETYAQNQGLNYQKLSDLDLNADLSVQIKGGMLLLDRLGELVNFYAICDVAVLCGSFLEHIGGHNPIEAAFFNKPIISGKFFHNQKISYESVENIIICEDVKHLQSLIDTASLQTQIRTKPDLSVIRASIDEGLKQRRELVNELSNEPSSNLQTNSTQSKNNQGLA